MEHNNGDEECENDMSMELVELIGEVYCTSINSWVVDILRED